MLIAQISDTHITSPGQTLDRHYQTALHLSRAVAHLCTLPEPPDLVFVTGDCVEGGSVPEYERFQSLLRPLSIPVYVLPGNHDDRANMLQVFGNQGTRQMEGYIQYVVEGWPVRLIALDTHVPGQPSGYLCWERLRWLEERLAEEPSRPTVIFQHHPPFATGIRVLDSMGLDGAEALGSIIARHPNVERILAGHVHRLMQHRFHGTLAVTCPSTAHQGFLDLRKEGRLAAIMEPPACLLHLWSDGGGLVTHTSIIDDYGPPDEVFAGKA